MSGHVGVYSSYHSVVQASQCTMHRAALCLDRADPGPGPGPGPGPDLFGSGFRGSRRNSWTELDFARARRC